MKKESFNGFSLTFVGLLFLPLFELKQWNIVSEKNFWAVTVCLVLYHFLDIGLKNNEMLPCGSDPTLHTVMRQTPKGYGIS